MVKKSHKIAIGLVALVLITVAALHLYYALAATDTSPPTTAISSPANSSSLSGTVALKATASDNVGVDGVQLQYANNSSFTGASTLGSPTYRSVVMGDNPQSYWRLDESSGTVYDQVTGTANNGTISGTVTRGVAGALASSPDSAITLNGSSGYIYTSKSYSNPTKFSLELWFKTSNGYNNGGVLIGFNSSQTGSGSTSYNDRVIFMSTGGNLYFGCKTGSSTYHEIGTTSPYNDGNWHHVVATLSSSGQYLYVDGTQAAFNSSYTSAYSYSGYWRLGYDNLSGWSNRPSNYYFGGTIDEAAVYTSALTATQVANHYSAATQAGAVTLQSGNAASGTWGGSWDTTWLADGTYYVRSVASDFSGNSTTSSYYTYTVDNTPPSVTAVSPTSGQTGVSTASTITATFSEGVQNVSASTFTVLAGGSPVAGTVSYNSSTHVATFTPSANLSSNTTYTATLTSGITDLAGNPLTQYTWNFTTANSSTPPTVTSTTPVSNQTGVSTATTITAAFSETVQNVNSSTFTVTSGGVPVAGTVSYNSSAHVATFTPSVPLSPGITYTATLSSAITDLSGNHLSPTSWSFTTAPVSGGGGSVPSVVSTSPLANQTGVSTGTTVTAVFNKNVQNVNSNTFTMYSGSKQVTGSVSYDSATYTAVFTPSSALAPSTVYTVTMTNGITDSSNNALAPTSWNFTTVMPDASDTTRGPHGAYTTNTAACASCHKTHTAKTKTLIAFTLGTGTENDNYKLCTYCHSATGSSKYDEVDGQIKDGGNLWATLGGGFQSMPAITGSAAIAQTVPVTSKHLVDGAQGSKYTIPGGSTAPNGQYQLECTSCHDPHGTGNSRQLVSKVTVYNGTGWVDVPTSPTGQSISISIGNPLQRETAAYNDDNMSYFCGACHADFLQTAAGSGETTTGTFSIGFYRHRINMPASSSGQTLALPLGKGTDVTCMTCHYAHGTTATVSRVTYNPSPPLTPATLLRMDERGVCENCHNKTPSVTPLLLKGAPDSYQADAEHNKFVLTFSAYLDSNSAQNISNYTVTVPIGQPTLSVNSAQLQPNGAVGSQVVLTLSSSPASGVSGYSINAAGVKDLSGNPIFAGASFPFTAK